MSIVNITDVTVKQNPAKFEEPYVFKITFECIAPLKEGKSGIHPPPQEYFVCSLIGSSGVARSGMETRLRRIG